MADLWPVDPPPSAYHRVVTCIRRLREVLGRLSSHVKIHNVHSKGYTLHAAEGYSG